MPDLITLKQLPCSRHVLNVENKMLPKMVTSIPPTAPIPSCSSAARLYHARRQKVDFISPLLESGHP